MLSRSLSRTRYLKEVMLPWLRSDDRPAALSCQTPLTGFAKNQIPSRAPLANWSRLERTASVQTTPGVCVQNALPFEHTASKIKKCSSWSDTVHKKLAFV